ncbi:16S rRNA (guanine(966)-N(2))-methyltransferase RsmD [Denitrobaculum tricleocarpae]|uniref:16S rRNA (Guanine(966)-N(2))-methyltransferase RsmD n=1 Tax=Denitrobaculum tricleocarpae TaxID=2591009 RepID=A0A545U1W1_9PROT|nr:16S rRNA (guanine(966)-N(2))-methyltransferase RsmD [Denitrobaculum tricleocarpae]TQV83436.1 16S rRNA (guanine(966)-N(2))-methyltransferase RsmD [Denitrobaculum tricleocarpae]
MRIVGGRHRGRPIDAPDGLTVRPTADRTRESMFNILCQGKLAEEGNPLIDAQVLDAFAGTGALGLEALSRGAAKVTFLENLAASLTACRANVKSLGEENTSDVLQADVLRPPPAREACSIILMDPPYNQDLPRPAILALDAAGWIAPAALVVVELMAQESFEVPEGFEELDNRKYGKARLIFLRKL